MQEPSSAIPGLVAGTLLASSHAWIHHTTGQQQPQFTPSNPPALACPHVPAAATHPLLTQPLPPSAVKQMGIKVPQRLQARGSLLLCDKADAHPPQRKRSCQPKSCGPFWGWQPWERCGRSRKSCSRVFWSRSILRITPNGTVIPMAQGGAPGAFIPAQIKPGAGSFLHAPAGLFHTH